MRRSATTLNSLLGISIPTALLPGIGASIRMLRAARAIARSSERPSIRLTLMCGAGWTSYWVTTGPALRPTMRASISKLASLRTICSSFQAWTAASLPAAASVGGSPASSSTCGGRLHAWSRLGGESDASVTSSGSRPLVLGSRAPAPAATPPATVAAVAPATPAMVPAAMPAAASAPWASPAAPLPFPLAGANVADTGDGDDAGASVSLPHTPVCPGASPGTGRGDRPRRPPLPVVVGGVPLLVACRSAAAAADTVPAALTVRSWRVEPATRAARVAGDRSVRNGASNAISNPATNMPSRMTNAPGVVSAGSSTLTRKRPIRPPVNAPENSTSCIRPSSPT